MKSKKKRDKLSKTFRRGAILKSKRSIQGEKTKETIYQTAITLFTRYGFQNITVERICQECGIAKGTFYVHYKSKEDIIKLIYKERAIIYIGERMQDFMDDASNNGLEELYYCCILSLEFCKSNGLELTALSYSTHLKSMTETHTNWYSIGYPLEQLRSIVEKCKGKNELKDTYSVDYIVSSLLIIINGSAVDWCLSNGEYDIVEQNKQVFYDLIFNVYAR